MKIASIPKRGRVGSVIYSETRHGKVARSYVPPTNPRTGQQQEHRSNFRVVSGRWSALTSEQHTAWRIVAANKYFVTDTGDQVRLNCYNLFVALNTRRADLGLPQFDLPPAEPVWSRNPVAELAITCTGDRIAIKLHVPSPPAQFTLVYGAAPVSSGASHAQHLPFLGLLPPPIDGWSDITDLYIARYGVPKAGKTIWIRTCQHIDGWTDTPKMVHARVQPPGA